MTASEINKQLKRVEGRFGHHVGHYSGVRGEYSQILRPAGLVQGGTGLVMSYKEAVARMRAGTNPNIDISYFTKEYYQSEVDRFYKEQKEHLYIKSEMKLQMEKMRDIVRDAYEYVGEDVADHEKEIQKYTYEELKEAINQSNAMYADKIYDTTDSYKFYERVIKWLIGNGDAETE